MTTITTAATHQPPRLSRRSIASFVAGLALASAVAVGVNVSSEPQAGSSPRPTLVTVPVVAPVVAPVAVVDSDDAACRLHRGPC